MSRIFKISGNFAKYGKWSEPDPSFSGEIVVDEKYQPYAEFCDWLYYSNFYGTCDELYNSDLMDINRTRYIAGVLVEDERKERQGIIFLKLSNDPEQDPLKYVVPDLANPERGSWWAALTPFFGFLQQGKAKITLEEETFSEEEAENIMEKYDSLERSAINKIAFEQTRFTRDIFNYFF